MSGFIKKLYKQYLASKEESMYAPKQFEEPRVDIMHELIRAHPLATLVTLSPSGLNANHIPLHLSESPAPFGTLRGHVARANPLLSDLTKGIESLAVFHGPDAYITGLVGKWKVSQSQPSQNHASVIARLKASGLPETLAMAALVEAGAKNAR